MNHTANKGHFMLSDLVNQTNQRFSNVPKMKDHVNSRNSNIFNDKFNTVDIVLTDQDSAFQPQFGSNKKAKELKDPKYLGIAYSESIQSEKKPFRVNRNRT